MYKELTDEQIQDILSREGISFSGEIQKSNIGFSSHVYFTGNYVLKVGKSQPDQEDLRREIFFYNFFQNKLPAPQVIASNTHEEPPYFIYKKLSGENLYRKWHQYTLKQKKNIVKQICQHLKLINSEDPQPYLKKFNIAPNRDWQQFILAKIQKWKQQALKKGIIDTSQVQRIKDIVTEQKDSLIDSKMALTHYDPHFDNILVDGKRVVGMLDLDRIDYLSIDYVLDLVKRMMEYPTKYVSKESKHLIEAKDYEHLLEWYREFYPDLFQPTQLNKRLNLYNIRYTLKILTLFPDNKQARDAFMKALTKEA